MTDTLKGALLVAGAAAIWGTWKIWFPPGGTLDPAGQGGLVLAFAGVVATIIALSTRRVRAPLVAWLGLGAFALGEAANYLLYFHALDAGDSAAAAATHYLAPVLVAVASPLLREPMGRRASWAAPIAFVATLALVGLGAGGDATYRAATLGAASALFYAFNILVAKRLGRWFTPWELVGFHNLGAAPLVLAMSSSPPWVVPAPELALGLTGALLGGTIAAGLYFAGLSRIPAARAAVLSYVEPVGAALVGVLVLGETLGLMQALAIGVVLAAGVAVASERAPATVRVGEGSAVG